MLRLDGHENATILVLEGMLDIVNECVPSLFLEVRNMALHAVREERQRRALGTPSIYQQVPLAVPQPFSYEGLSDFEVRFWYALGAEIADYSCVGRGVRPHVNAVYLQSQAEMDRRGLKCEFFCDL